MPFTFTDHFNRANESPIKEPYHALLVDWDNQLPNLLSNEVRGEFFAHSPAIYVGTTFDPDVQTAQVTITALAPSTSPASIGVYCRAIPTAGVSYYGQVSYNGRTFWSLYLVTPDNFFPLFAHIEDGITYHTGDILLLKLNGPVLEFYQNGQLKVSGADGTLSEGNFVGFDVGSYGPGYPQAIDDFICSGEPITTNPNAWPADATFLDP